MGGEEAWGLAPVWGWDLRPWGLGKAHAGGLGLVGPLLVFFLGVTSIWVGKRAMGRGGGTLAHLSASPKLVSPVLIPPLTCPFPPPSLRLPLPCPRLQWLGLLPEPRPGVGRRQPRDQDAVAHPAAGDGEGGGGERREGYGRAGRGCW